MEIINAYDKPELKQEKALLNLVEKVLEWNGMSIVNKHSDSLIMGQVSREEISEFVCGDLVNKFKVEVEE